MRVHADDAFGPAMKRAAGAALVVLGAVGLVFILTNGDRDRAGAALTGAALVIGVRLLRGHPVKWN